MKQRQYFVLSFALGLLVFGATCYRPECITKCGLHVTNTTWSCDAIQYAETRTMEEFQKVPDTRLHTCDELAKYRLETVDLERFVVPDGRVVAGVTYCQSKSIVINNSYPTASSFPHEIAHVLQFCDPLPPYDDSDYYHSNWEDGGIYSAVNRVELTGE